MSYQPSRRRFQFRLRTLLIVVTLLAVASWLIADRVRLIRERDEARNQLGKESALLLDALGKEPVRPATEQARLDKAQINELQRRVSFEGESERTGDKWNAVKDEWVHGSIPEQINRTAEIIDSQIRRFSVLGKNGKFNADPEYPRDAWYEALVNACVHRSYHYKNMNIFVRMFDDHLEIESPGPFPPGVSPQSIYDIQHSRNPYIMEAMHYLDYVKAANEGVRRIRNTMLELDLPAPEFSQVEVGGTKVKVVLRNNIRLRRLWIDSDVTAVLGAAIVARLSENEKLAVNFVALHRKINVSDVMRLTGHNWHRSRKLLRELEEEKHILRYIRRAGADIDRQAYWELNAPPGAN